MSSIALRNPESGTSCEIEGGRGFVYAIEAATPDGVEALLDQLLEVPGSQVAHGVGGMISNINVLENIALPAIYHKRARSREFDTRVIEAFAACGLPGAEAEALCRRHPGELSAFEKHLVGFVRCLLMEPDVLVYNRFLEGLTGAGMERAVALDAVYRGRHPAGTSVYLMLSDLPALQFQCHRRYVT